jgi:hypothetical protein
MEPLLEPRLVVQVVGVRSSKKSFVLESSLMQLMFRALRKSIRSVISQTRKLSDIFNV